MAGHHSDAGRFRSVRDRQRLCDTLPCPHGSRARHRAHMAPGTAAVTWYRGRAALVHQLRLAQYVPQFLNASFLTHVITHDTTSLTLVLVNSGTTAM
jgi:hypothetical protein